MMILIHDLRTPKDGEMVKRGRDGHGDERAWEYLNPCITIPVRIPPAPAPRHDNSTSLNNDLNAAQTANA